MLTNFFQLPDSAAEITLQDDFFRLVKDGGEIRTKIYRPFSLRSPEPPQRWLVRDCHFIEFSFSKTLIEEVEFRKCTFTDCLFIGSIFRNCRFSDCKFVDSNTFRVEFSDVYIDPASFARCLNERLHQNIGVHLYQELLNNSRRQSQPDFANTALYQFRRWQRFENIYRFKQSRKTEEGWLSRSQLTAMIRIGESWIVQKIVGFGVRLRNYAVTACCVAIGLASLNYYFAPHFGLKSGAVAISSFADAFYFTIITLTTVGYGDITPTTELGRSVIAAEGVFGFVLFATLASMIYRKILP